MKTKQNKNTAFYYIFLCIFFIVLFFSNDFSITDVQKTAIVIAVGIDKEDEEFKVTAQVSLPSEEKEGGAQTTQIVSKGKTVAKAFSSINAKTGWYPKLVFCKLILLGKEMVKSNVFDALDFFLRDEYLPDSCLVAATDENAQDVLSVKTPVDKISGIAVQKVLSDHAKRLGTVAPTTLREFSQEYYSHGKSGLLPLVKTQSPTEVNKSKPKDSSSGQESGQGGGQNSAQGNQGGQSGKSNSSADQEKVFQASKSLLFKDGKSVGELDEKSTFAFCFVKNKLRLADYNVSFQGDEYTLNFRQNRPSVSLEIDKNGVPRLEIKVNATAGLSDVNRALPLPETEDAGEIPDGLLDFASKTLTDEIFSAINTCHSVNCDALELFSKLKRHNADYFHAYKDDLLSRLVLSVQVKIDSVR